MTFDQKKIIYIFITVIVGIAGLYGAWKVVSKPKEVAKVVIDTSKDKWVMGDKKALIVLVEYADFQCPACRAFLPIVKKTVDSHKSQIKFVYRHFPLSQHKNAKIAAYAAEAAGRQGRFFQMHDILFDRQDDWSKKADPGKLFITYAKELSLDDKQFATDMESKVVRKNVEDHIQQGIGNGVSATPTFYLNGVKLDTSRSAADFENAVAGAVGP